jgi:hypothetical protein
MKFARSADRNLFLVRSQIIGLHYLSRATIPGLLFPDHLVVLQAGGLQTKLQDIVENGITSAIWVFLKQQYKKEDKLKNTDRWNMHDYDVEVADKFKYLGYL